MLSFCETHGLRLPSAIKRNEKGPHALQELTTPCKRQDSNTTSAARNTFSNGSNWGHLGHGNCRPSPKLGHKRLLDTGLRTLGHRRKSGERNTLVGKTYKRG